MSNECRLKLEWVPEAYKDTHANENEGLKKPTTSKPLSMLYNQADSKSTHKLMRRWKK